MKKVIRLITTILVVSIIVVGLSFLIEGVPLFGTPDVEKVERIIVEHADYPDEVKEYTDNDKIELAIALLGNLKYSPLKRLTDDNRLITITYIMDGGVEYIVSANNYTVWWNGKPSAIKNENQFVKLCMAIFYPEKELIYGEIQEPSDNDIINGEGEPLEIEGISQEKAEEIALEQCKVNYDYIKTEFNSTEKRWYVELWENMAKDVATQTVLIDTEGNVLGSLYAE